ncbi:rhodanese-like domain-containing protein [Geomicrobium sediminis]|uniref:Rhodanese-related sulfurtransferase n=1 Tax=Geomicrobium sediminis TaxID=1347788 RepID=A0ABS2PF23_9BACL|nr:rhodanese-like domain-containing protein [Geomicrobium sediminis]MBM7634013.1 rhodanese-related sulfurtransferase [Geomicrobium sediminis]
MRGKYIMPIILTVITLAFFLMFNPFTVETEVEEAGEWVEIDQNEVNAEIGEESVELVDLREEELYEAGHIPGSILIPYEEFQQRYHELNADKRIILICHTGRMGVESAEFLVDQGFDDVANFGGGMAVWEGPLEVN